MDKLGHPYVDIMKADIEGSEFAVIPQMLNAKNPYFCQLLVEVHGANARQWVELFTKILDADYFMFSKEINANCCGPGFCVEYAFVHKTCAMSLGLEETPFQTNFQYGARSSSSTQSTTTKK